MGRDREKEKRVKRVRIKSKRKWVRFKVRWGLVVFEWGFLVEIPVWKHFIVINIKRFKGKVWFTDLKIRGIKKWFLIKGVFRKIIIK